MSLLDPDWISQHGLHPEAVMAVVTRSADPRHPLPADIHENGPFLRLLSRTIFESIDQCDAVRHEAQIQGSGHVYLLDGRIPDPGGRVASEDVIGTIEVQDGKLVAGTYQHNTRHRLFTANGWFRLPVEIETALLNRLRARTGA
ncbi:hypothetical protein KRMM14A1259_71890 [Krasilnikovia sp. MM14-A1259]